MMEIHPLSLMVHHRKKRREVVRQRSIRSVATAIIMRGGRRWR